MRGVRRGIATPAFALVHTRVDPRESRRTHLDDGGRMAMLPTFYKRGSGRRTEPCLLCMTTHRGPTVEAFLGFGVTVFLCEQHASREFRRQRGGRDFNLSMERAFTAAGCFTRNRQKALDAIWNLDRARETEPPPTRARPGSYAWPHLRELVEDACRRGIVSMRKLRALIQDHLRAELRRGRVRLPSDRTLRRWRSERRWELAAEPT